MTKYVILEIPDGKLQCFLLDSVVGVVHADSMKEAVKIATIGTENLVRESPHHSRPYGLLVAVPLEPFYIVAPIIDRACGFPEAEQNRHVLPTWGATP